MRLSRDSSASMRITGKRATSPTGNAIVFRHDALTVECVAPVPESIVFLAEYLGEHSAECVEPSWSLLRMHHPMHGSSMLIRFA